MKNLLRRLFSAPSTGLHSSSTFGLDANSPDNWATLAEHHERCRQQYDQQLAGAKPTQANLDKSRLREFHTDRRDHFRGLVSKPKLL